MYRLSYLLALSFFLSSCDPVELRTEDGDIAFSVEMNIDGEEYNFEAGVDDYFMETNVFNVPGLLTQYTGTLLKRINDQTIDDELLLTLNFYIGEEVNNSADLDHLNSFKTGSIPFYTVDDTVLPLKEVSFIADYDGTGTDVVYNWNYGDGITTNFSNPIHAYGDLGLYTAVLTVNDNNQCSASSSNTVAFDGREDCNATIAITNLSNASAVLESTSVGTAPYTYVWSDGSVGSDLSISITDASGVQEHCVTITDANGCVSTNCIGIVKDGNGAINTCSTSMTESNYIKARTAKQFNSVNVNWILQNPLDYNSAEVLQPSTSYFNVLSFEEYERDELGNRTVKIDFEFSCLAYITLGSDPVLIEKAKGTFAVAIPD